jgi:hypothetical protein
VLIEFGLAALLSVLPTRLGPASPRMSAAIATLIPISRPQPVAFLSKDAGVVSIDSFQGLRAAATRRAVTGRCGGFTDLTVETDPNRALANSDKGGSHRQWSE